MSPRGYRVDRRNGYPQKLVWLNRERSEFHPILPEPIKHRRPLVRPVALAIAAIVVALLLSGCSGNPLTEDANLLTLGAPDPKTDCQYRVTTARTNGKGLVVDGGFVTRIVTFIGPKNCPEGMVFDVPVTRMVVPNRGLEVDVLRGLSEEMRELRMDIERLKR